MGSGYSGGRLFGIPFSRVGRSRGLAACVVVCALSALLWPAMATAQDGDAPLGDVARNLRKSKAQQQLQSPSQPSPQPPLQPLAQPAAAARPVIDNDNLAQALDDLKKVKSADRFVFSVDSAGKGFKVSAPDVTCSMAFSARAASLLIKPVIVEDLPAGELAKLDGPASIQDDNLQLEVFNGTEWELREITVGITLERKPGESAEVAARARVIPAAESLASPVVERHSDVTVLYHLKAAAKPFSTTVFREAIGIGLGADQDWHWSIVEAKGVRPPGSQTPPDVAPTLPAMPLPNLTGRGGAAEPGVIANVPPMAAAVNSQAPEPAKPAADRPNSDRTTHDKAAQDGLAGERPDPSKKK
jgi:hypothetical protein